MRSFKKMLAALSAVTIAFGAMALTASAEVNKNLVCNGAEGTGSTGDIAVASMVEGSKYVVSYTGVNDDLGVYELKMYLKEKDTYNWIEGSIRPTTTSYSDGVTTNEYSYDSIVKVLEGKGLEISDLGYIGFENTGFWGWNGSASVEVKADVTITSGPSYAFNATETEGGMMEAKDGWCAKAYVFSYDSGDVAVTYSATVNGQTQSADAVITGETTYGLIIAAPVEDYDTIYGMSAPVITIN